MLHRASLCLVLSAFACSRLGSADKADRADRTIDRSAPSSEPPVATEPTVQAPDRGPTAQPALQAQRPAKVHRASAVACSQTRDPGKVGWGTQSDCKSDAECKAGKNGRCTQFGLRAGCTYDACFADADCKAKGAGGVCACRTGAGSPNQCVGGNCQLDVDCKGWSCSPSLGSMGRIHGIVGYYCHGPQDACIDDEDCNNGASCRYAPELGHFACSSSEVHPG
ncbi:MAG: hypothetical protein U0174_19525 [Polyangiaceae bacterium]